MEHSAGREKRRQHNQFCLLLSFASSLQRLSPQHSWGWGRSAPCIPSLTLVGALNGEPGDHSWVRHSIRSHTNNFPQAAPWHPLLYHCKVSGSQLRKRMITPPIADCDCCLSRSTQNYRDIKEEHAILDLVFLFRSWNE